MKNLKEFLVESRKMYYVIPTVRLKGDKYDSVEEWYGPFDNENEACKFADYVYDSLRDEGITIVNMSVLDSEKAMYYIRSIWKRPDFSEKDLENNARLEIV